MSAAPAMTVISVPVSPFRQKRATVGVQKPRALSGNTIVVPDGRARATSISSCCRWRPASRPSDAPISRSTPIHDAGRIRGVHSAADQSQRPVMAKAADGRYRVAMTPRPAAIAPRPHHPQPGNRTPAAVIGCAHPRIPKGGTAITTHAIMYRSGFCHPLRSVQSTTWTTTKADEAASQSKMPGQISEE